MILVRCGWWFSFFILLSAWAFVPPLPGILAYVSPPPARNRPALVKRRTGPLTWSSSLLASQQQQQQPPESDQKGGGDVETKQGDQQDNGGVRRTRQELSPLTKRMTLTEYAEREQQAARDLENRLLLPNRIGKAVNVLLYTFVILGFVLNLFGLAYVKSPDGWSVTIDTIEARRFQDEINRTTKTTPAARN
jgi:hypothetical protein